MHRVKEQDAGREDYIGGVYWDQARTPGVWEGSPAGLEREKSATREMVAAGKERRKRRRKAGSQREAQSRNEEWETHNKVRLDTVWQQGRRDDRIFPSCLHQHLFCWSGCTFTCVSTVKIQHGVKHSQRASVTDRFHLVGVVEALCGTCHRVCA